MSAEIDELHQKVAALRQEVEALKQLICLTELSGPGLRLAVKGDEKVLQYFNNSEWVEVPVSINPL